MSGRVRRCAFREGSRRCTRNGFGNPPLCRTHAIQVGLHGEEGEEDDPIISLIDIADRAFSRNRNEIVQNARQIFGEFLAQRANQRNAKRVPPPPPPKSPPPPRPPPPPPEDPRDILGFPPGTKLTKALVKARQRELAQLFHPDKGGSVKAMQKVNDAAAKLLATL